VTSLSARPSTTTREPMAQAELLQSRDRWRFALLDQSSFVGRRAMRPVAGRKAIAPNFFEGLLCGQLHGVRLCTGGQWITWIVESGHKLMA
jgi:hypothetical protein